ncbi:methyltransferase domain-containing protein [Maricurvus nonylphenolicus]|uniref:methyltransferase domain-containing protein n=1 Tax=Maricurvus nonylphenolicus TaxID=1008307 RepID=UPI0036F1A712
MSMLSLSGKPISRWRRWLLSRFGVLPMAETLAELEGESDTPLAQLLFEYERQAIDEALGCLFGYHLLEASVFDLADLTASSTINHKFSLSLRDNTKRQQVQGLAEFDQLPLAEQCLDVALLHHVLEFSENPHQVLREVSRTIIPRGHVVIVGFNPLSLSGLGQSIAQLFSRKCIWRRHRLRVGRVLDWLRLLDFEPVSLQQGFYRPPINHPWALKKMGGLEKLGRKLKLPFGGFYVIVARKEVSAMIPIKPKWDRFNPMAGLVIGKPTSRLPEPVRQQPLNRKGQDK